MSDSPKNEQNEKGFVVVDRRGGTPDEREESSEPSGTREANGDERGASTDVRGELPRIDFSTFVLSLSTSALYHLGLVADPETGKPAERNLPLARQSIDTLEMLQEKTRGNLEEDEAKLLESLLYELHLRFVESSRSSGP